MTSRPTPAGLGGDLARQRQDHVERSVEQPSAQPVGAFAKKPQAKIRVARGHGREEVVEVDRPKRRVDAEADLFEHAAG